MTKFVPFAMKIFRYPLLILTVLLLSCSQDKSSQSTAFPEGMVMLDLSDKGKNFYLPVPDTNAARLSVTEAPDGALQVTVGKNFGLAIYEDYLDIQIAREDILSDEVNRHQRWLTDSSNVLIWESAITASQFHLMVNREIGGRPYGFRELQQNDFSEEDVLQMRSSVLAATQRDLKRP